MKRKPNHLAEPFINGNGEVDAFIVRIDQLPAMARRLGKISCERWNEKREHIGMRLLASIGLAAPKKGKP